MIKQSLTISQKLEKSFKRKVLKVCLEGSGLVFGEMYLNLECIFGSTNSCKNFFQPSVTLDFM